MKVLLDTHVFLWWIIDNLKLPIRVCKIIEDSSNELFFSAASCWEIVIKASLGRIKLPDKPGIFISNQMSINSVLSLPVYASHALHVFNLPSIHRDPFDRIIAAQAQLENLPVITSDNLFAKYKVEVIW